MTTTMTESRASELRARRREFARRSLKLMVKYGQRLAGTPDARIACEYAPSWMNGYEMAHVEEHLALCREFADVIIGSDARNSLGEFLPWQVASTDGIGTFTDAEIEA